MLLAFVMIFVSLCGCGEKPVDVVETTSVETEEIDTGFILIKDGEATCKIVRAELASDYVSSLAVSVKKALNEIYNGSYPINTDWIKGNPESVQNDDFEILVGETNRAESIQFYSELGENKYGYKIINNKLVIGGYTASDLALAVKTFNDNVLSNPERYKDGVLAVLPEDCCINVSDRPIQLSDMIQSGSKYRIQLTQVIATGVKGTCKVAQGAASDGEYVYFLIRPTGDGDGRIFKYSLETGKYVAASPFFHVFHGNDMTYCKSKNLLYVVHGSSEGKILTTVDPETMQVVTQSVNIPVGAGAITYSWEKDIFAVSQGGKTLHFMTTNYKATKSLSKNYTSGYIAQGMGSDETYIYFPMSGESDNILMVYDWNGNYVTDVHLQTTLEAESMFWVNDTYYVNFYKSGNGAVLYRLDILPK